MKRQFKRDNLIILLEILAIGVILFPVIYISMHAIPAYDDFCNAVVFKRMLNGNNSFIAEVFNQLWDYYTKWGGYLLSLAIVTFFQPFMYGGLEGLRVTILLMNLCFYYSLWFLVSTVIKAVYGVSNRKALLGIYIPVLLTFAAGSYYNEDILAWYCDVGEYVLVVSCMFWSVGFLVKALYFGKVKWIVWACVLGFLTSGGTLNVAALNCGIFLVIGLLYCAGGGQKRKWIFLCFASALSGAILNVLAPGNYVRNGGITSGSSIITALVMAIDQSVDRLRFVFFSTPFAVILIILFVCLLIFLRGDINYKYPMPAGLAVIMLSGIIVVNFPVFLGYGGYFPKRCVWVEDCVIYLGSFILVFCFAGWLKKRNRGLELKRDTIMCISICCILSFCSLGGESVEQFWMVNAGIAKGEIREASQYWEDVLYEIEHSENDSVVIVRDKKPESDFINDIGIIEREDSWVNLAVAEYYGKRSVSFVINSGNK